MILIVDDKQENIFSLKTILELHGFATDAALSGEEALKKVLKKDYALIILDVQMPVMDGFEVAEAITGLNKTKDIPIIFLSAASTHKKYITKGFQSGAVEYLTKPVDPEILILKVRNFYSLYEKTDALKKAEKSLSDSLAELHLTLESLPQLAFTADRNGKLEFVNKQWFRYAATQDEFPDLPDGNLQNQWLQKILPGLQIEMEVNIRSLETGEYQYHLLRAIPISVNGIISKWVGTFTNIHEQKLLSETLELRVAERTRQLLDINRELEITNHDLQQFTFVASHDLKEPLRKILFFGNLVKDRSGLDEQTSKYLDKILQSAGRMSSLISDLLSFARLSEASKFELTDLNKLVSDILVDLELSIAEKKASITVHKLLSIEVIPGLMRQLFQNMISNALKFSKPGVQPKIEVSSEFINQPTVDSAASKNGAFCRITVKDNGIGFDEKYAEKIFTIFQRLNAKEEYEGTGIGLAIAKKIVDRHNGWIGARSQPGLGSSFIVILPVVQIGMNKTNEQIQDIATTI